jgi:hypothetical protein
MNVSEAGRAAGYGTPQILSSGCEFNQGEKRHDHVTACLPPLISGESTDPSALNGLNGFAPFWTDNFSDFMPLVNRDLGQSQGKIARLNPCIGVHYGG